MNYHKILPLDGGISTPVLTCAVVGISTVLCKRRTFAQNILARSSVHTEADPCTTKNKMENCKKSVEIGRISQPPFPNFNGVIAAIIRPGKTKIWHAAFLNIVPRTG